MSPVEQNNNTNNNLPNLKLSVKLKYVKLGYHYLITNGMYLALIPLIGVSSTHLISRIQLQDLLVELKEVLRFHLLTTMLCSCLTVFLATLFFMNKPRKVYLLDFACYKPDSALKCPKEIFMERITNAGTFSQKDIDFQKKILERSGLGQETYFPPAIIRNPPNPCLEEARKEAEMVMFGAIDQLLEKTGVRAKDIGILVVNCTTFTPIPSPSAMIVNHYKLRGNILSYNVAGMGCSASLIAIDLDKFLLQVLFLVLKF